MIHIAAADRAARHPSRSVVTLLVAVLLVGACGSASGGPATTPAATRAALPASSASAGAPTSSASAGAPTGTPPATDGPQAPRPDPSSPGGPTSSSEPTGQPTAGVTPAPSAPPSAPLIAAATPSPAPPAPTPTPVLDPKPKAGKFKLDLYHPKAFVAQFTRDWCVAASMQMMANMIDPARADRSRETQRQMYIRAREISPWTERGPGASIVGWIGTLTERGFGRFEELADPDYDEALRILARQMRFTNKPAGLWVWNGEHAWVVSGFTSTADPAYTDAFDVTGVWVEDPWYGRVSRLWGPGRKPHTYLSPRQLRRAWTPFSSVHRPQYGEKGMFVVIAPVA